MAHPTGFEPVASAFGEVLKLHSSIRQKPKNHD